MFRWTPCQPMPNVQDLLLHQIAHQTMCGIRTLMYFLASSYVPPESCEDMTDLYFFASSSVPPAILRNWSCFSCSFFFSIARPAIFFAKSSTSCLRVHMCIHTH